MAAIYDTQEYKLADQEAKHKAFARASERIDLAAMLEKHGVNPEREVTVTSNQGKTTVKTRLGWFSIEPDLPKVKYAGNTYFMIKGSKPSGKTAEFITLADFDASPEVKKLRDEVVAAQKAETLSKHEELKSELRKTHSALAKKAVKELPGLMKGTDPTRAVYDWFHKNGFEMVGITPKDFTNFVKRFDKTGHIHNEWEIESKPDGWGHQQGVNGVIDFNKAKIGKMGWSSDD